MKVVYTRPALPRPPLSMVAGHLCTSFAGFKAHDITPTFAGSRDREVDADVIVVWGWKRGHLWKEKNPHANVLVLEMGYLTDRNGRTRRELMSMSWNGLNGHASFGLPERDDLTRWNSMYDAPSPQHRDGPVFLNGQVRNDASLYDCNDIDAWYVWMEKKLRQDYPDREIYWRKHPLAVGRPYPVTLPAYQGTLEQALRCASLFVAYNSNALIDAVQAGVPVLGQSRGSMCAPLFENRWGLNTWKARVAWTQWTPEEVASGAAWDMVRTGLGRPGFSHLPL